MEGRRRGPTRVAPAQTLSYNPSSMLAPTAAPVRRRSRVLVVEDHLDCRQTLCEVLVLYGYEVLEAIDGPQAVAIATEHRPDAVLLDLGLPGMDGYQVARALRADPRLADTLIAAVTGFCMAPDRRRALEAGCDLFLVKPVGIEQLIRVLDSVAPRASCASR